MNHQVVVANTAETLRDVVAGLSNLSPDDRVVFDLNDKDLRRLAAPDAIPGVQLLNWMRILGIRNHCIVIGDSDLLSYLDGSPRNAILASTGVTVSKPVSTEEARPRDSGLAELNQIKEILRIDLDGRAWYHEAANRFGLLRLLQHHLDATDTPTEDRAELSTLDPGANELEHEIIKFVSSPEPISFPVGPTSQEKAEARNLLGRLRNLPDKKVFLIDDRADQGWAQLLKVILGDHLNNNVIFDFETPTESSTPDELAGKVSAFIRSYPGGWKAFIEGSHLVISDLKLLDVERDETDYTRLLSYQTVRKMRTPPIADSRLRLMYLTASNNLSRVKELLRERSYSPHAVYTKEGAEQYLDDRQSFQKYIELLKELNELLGPDGWRRGLENIQVLNVNEEESRNHFVRAAIDQLMERQLFDVDSRKDQVISATEEADEIVLDTNVFVDRKTAVDLIDLLIAAPEKIRVLATVRHELRTISSNRSERRGSEDVQATFFDSLLSRLGINDIWDEIDASERRVIENNLGYGKDWADASIIRYLTARPNTSRVRFISHDKDVRLEARDYVTRVENIRVFRSIAKMKAGNEFE